MENVNAQSSVTTRSVGVKYGLISALIGLVMFLGLAIAGANAFDQSWSWVGIVATIVLLVLAHKNYKDNGTGFMTYGQGVGIGFWMALVSVLISGVITLVYVSFIDPGAMEIMWEAQAEKMAAQGVPDEQIEMGLSIGQKMFWPMYFFMGLLGGVIVALIVSIFTQKKNPQPVF
jgi:hypothetical protein